ncbi:MAG: hypothetical protein WB817_15860 [Terriglobales bacterium]
MNESQTDGKVGGELLDELFSALEDLETQSAGILQFLKDKGLATDKELAPYLEEAANASEVRWRAARLRLDALLAAAIHDAEEEFARKVEERSHKESTTGKKKEPSEGEREAGEDRNAQMGQTADEASAFASDEEDNANEAGETAKKERGPRKEEEKDTPIESGEESSGKKAA